MRVVLWLLRAFLFFALFAFALNNRDLVVVHWFFGAHWSAPLVIVVLVAFGFGCAFGVLAMVPAWWSRRARARASARAAASADAGAPPITPPDVAPSGFGPTYPPREGL